MRVKAEQKGLLFVYQAAPDLPQTVVLDEKRLCQVLLNLLGNAFKFTDRGQVCLRVDSAAQDERHARLHFEVRDTGVGLQQEQFETIFQPFEQVGDMRRRFGGTGLGLSISRQLVRLMNSDIHVDSMPGKGSVFSFALPVALAEKEQVAGPIEHDTIGYQGDIRKILIVDDLAANRAVLSDLLHSLGFATCDAADGQEGVRQACPVCPDLILMDLMMPVMDGLEAIRRIRRVPSLSGVPIIMVSASATQQEQDSSMAAGADAFMTKPIDQMQLLQRIGEHLGLTWIHAHAQEQPALHHDDITALMIPPPQEIEQLHQLALSTRT